MSLLSLPPELRLQILSYLPDLYPRRYETVGQSVRLTPTICRTCRTLRREALPLYVRDATFIISLQPGDVGLVSTLSGVGREGKRAEGSNDGGEGTKRTSRVGTWLDALEVAGGLEHVGSLQLSRDWKVDRPSRWLCHVGFYVRLQRRGARGRARSGGGGGDGGTGMGSASGNRSIGSSGAGAGGGWACVTGTYPIANDRRQSRIESALVLRAVVERWLNSGSQAVDGDGGAGGGTVQGRVLSRRDVEFVVAAMDIVASRPTPGYVVERNLGLWDKMLAELKALEVNAGAAGGGDCISYSDDATSGQKVSLTSEPMGLSTEISC